MAQLPQLHWYRGAHHHNRMRASAAVLLALPCTTCCCCAGVTVLCSGLARMSAPTLTHLTTTLPPRLPHPLAQLRSFWCRPATPSSPASCCGPAERARRLWTPFASEQWGRHRAQVNFWLGS